jgi:hypothetical protein
MMQTMTKQMSKGKLPGMFGGGKMAGMRNMKGKKGLFGL